jgi:hypothetical protein
VHAAEPVPEVRGLQPQLLAVPPGFEISVYSDGVPKARTMSATVVNGSTIVYVGSKETSNRDPTGSVSAGCCALHHHISNARRSSMHLKVSQHYIELRSCCPACYRVLASSSCCLQLVAC